MIKFKKGETVIAVSSCNTRQLSLKVPHENMCNKLLRRYLVQMLGENPDLKWTFVPKGGV